MKIVIKILFICLIVFSGCSNKTSKQLIINYFEQAPPNVKAIPFAPGIVTFEDYYEYGGHFSPDGKEFFLTRHQGGPAEIVFTKFDGKSWSPLKRMPFMDQHPGGESCLAPCGNMFYYNRFFENEELELDHDIFMSVRTKDGWDTPGAVTDIELGKRRVCPSVSGSHNLYFSSLAEDQENNDIVISYFMDGKYTAPVNPGQNVNSSANESHVFVAPDESYILFDSGRDGGCGASDIYVSFNDGKSGWLPAQNLGEPINSSVWDWYPTVTPDNKFIIFARSDSTGIDLYWYKADIIEELRGQIVK